MFILLTDAGLQWEHWKKETITGSFETLLFRTHGGDGVIIESASDQGGNLAGSYGVWGISKWRLWLRLCMVGGGEAGMGRQGAPPGLHSRWERLCVSVSVHITHGKMWHTAEEAVRLQGFMSDSSFATIFLFSFPWSSHGKGLPKHNVCITLPHSDMPPPASHTVQLHTSSGGPHVSTTVCSPVCPYR